MEHIEFYFKILVIIQLLHSQEEIWGKFEKRWPVWKMSREFFVTVEILFSALLILMFFIPTLPYRYQFMVFFNWFMFANGIWHMMWAAIEKRYVPGLITAPFFIIVFSIFYFNLF